MRRKSKLREYLETIIVALVLALLIRAFVVQAFKIPSGSMEPTLLVGDHLLVNKFIYGIKIPFTNKKFFTWKKPERGDVIVFTYPLDKSKDFIKRVIGVEEDRIRIEGKRIFINERLWNDNFGAYKEGSFYYRGNFGPITIPKDSLFVMGDNRDRSYDSRFWGFVKLDQVKGKAFIIYWSWPSPGIHIRWKRFGHLIH